MLQFSSYSVSSLTRRVLLGAMNLTIFLLLVIFLGASAFHAPILSSMVKSNTMRTRTNELQMISHGMGFNRLGRPADQRKALLRGLTTEVIRHGRIRTTITRAKAMRKRVDHMITLAKRGTLHTRRQALAYIYDKTLVQKLFLSAQERYGTRNGGYCRVIREKRKRRGDGATMAIIELV